ncbi:hypothetical protein [Bacillus toyonensis]|uniref:hypothetical protein n=1 Tax=Bacillus toyonensis TaxID=155322 RepID=UPI000BEF7120|nr:hypothetical protein [Bacillus toyonensis]PEL39978.1 hypothetical protein CN638_30990 [Bacillus toyonensis]
MTEEITILSQEERDQICILLTKQFIIPDPYKEAIKVAMLKYQNNLTEKRAEELVSQSFSPLDTLKFKFNHNNQYEGISYSRWKGFFTEWIIALNYNTFVNEGNVVMTIVNPDPTSKCDLLHIVKVWDNYNCYPGPDVKTGSADYLLNQLKRICDEKREIAFYDAYGVLSEENSAKLTEKQKKRKQELQKEYPNKKILQPEFTSADLTIITYDFLHYVATEELPSKRTSNIPENTKEVFQLLNNAQKSVDKIKRKSIYPLSFNDLKLNEVVKCESKRGIIKINNININQIDKQNEKKIQGYTDKCTIENNSELKPSFKLIRESNENKSSYFTHLIGKGYELIKKHEEPLKKVGVPLLQIGSKLILKKLANKTKKPNGFEDTLVKTLDIAINHAADHVTNIEKQHTRGGWNVEGKTYDNEFWVPGYTRADGTPVKGHWKGGRKEK